MTIEERLKESISLPTNSGILWSQWSFDKSLLGHSLNVISSIFPHYSLHEVSHSNSVISEIEKILGSNIGKLSFIDAWLLLEASYWHDVGMIVTFEEKVKLLKEEGFANFLHQLIIEKSYLTSYANIFTEYMQGNLKTNFIELEKSFLLVLAEYVRREHPDRSKEILLDPAAVGIKSPATGLIHYRLFLLLSDIIKCHGKPFDSILKIPFENDGLDVFDSAHPRFIACLLRIGDLLDLDDGRYCPTLLKTIGSLPSLSSAHFEKNRSIISKNVNEDYIEIISKCEDFDAFEIQNEWFALIRSEFSDQDKNWGDITPKGLLWKLPNLKNLICELQGNIPIGNSSNRLMFDTNRVYDYISGVNLYNTPLSYIDELLQNASDAIIDRIWIEHKKIIKTIDDFDRITGENNYRIDVNISDPEIISDTEMVYRIEIKDNGKGMSINDIQGLMTIASDKSRISKEKYRYGMPDWMRPSGFFGIGLQSVLAVTDKITINTSHPNDLNYEITIKKTVGKTPSIIVKKSNDIRWGFGTSIALFLTVPQIPVSISGSRLPSIGLYQFDPLTDKTLDSMRAEIIEKINDFANFSKIKIYYNGERCGPETDKANTLMIVDTDNGLEYSLEFHLVPGTRDWYYRGRKAEDNIFLDYISIVGNILSGSADAFLTLDRQKFHKDGSKKTLVLISKSLIDNKATILQKIKNKKVASLYYFLYDKIDNNDWRTIELFGHTINDLIKPDSKIFLAPYLHMRGTIDFDDKSKERIIITNEDWEVSTLIKILVKSKLGINIKNISTKKYTEKFSPGNYETQVFEVEIMGDKEASIISDDAIKYLSLQELSGRRTRYWLPCGKDQYQEIALDAECMNRYLWMDSLTAFSALFPKGIILRSTHNTIEDDINTLISIIKKEKMLMGISISEASIRNSLESFYKKFTFNSRKDPRIDRLLKNLENE
jgi:hypothetical protein